MLLSKGPIKGVFNQLQFPAQAYRQMAIAAAHAWRQLPAKGDKSQEITKILQGPESDQITAGTSGAAHWKAS
jgi:hypothetical protein